MVVNGRCEQDRPRLRTRRGVAREDRRGFLTECRSVSGADIVRCQLPIRCGDSKVRPRTWSPACGSSRAAGPRDARFAARARLRPDRNGGGPRTCWCQPRRHVPPLRRQGRSLQGGLRGFRAGRDASPGRGRRAAGSQRRWPVDQLLAACIAYLRECSSPGELQRIGLRQSRAVLGWESWRDAAAPLGIAALKTGVQAAVDAGELASDDVTITTHLLLSALVEAGLLAATDPKPERALARIEPEITRLLGGLRTP